MISEKKTASRAQNAAPKNVHDDLCFMLFSTSSNRLERVFTYSTISIRESKK